MNACERISDAKIERLIGRARECLEELRRLEAAIAAQASPRALPAAGAAVSDAVADEVASAFASALEDAERAREDGVAQLEYMLSLQEHGDDDARAIYSTSPDGRYSLVGDLWLIDEATARVHSSRATDEIPLGERGVVRDARWGESSVEYTVECRCGGRIHMEFDLVERTAREVSRECTTGPDEYPDVWLLCHDDCPVQWV